MKNLIIIFLLISLITFTAIVKNSSKKIEEEIFIKEENLRIFKEKYELVFLEFTYLSRPSRLLAIMLNDKNEEYIHLETSNLKIFSEKKEKYLNKF